MYIEAKRKSFALKDGKQNRKTTTWDTMKEMIKTFSKEKIEIIDRCFVDTRIRNVVTW